MSPSPTKPKPMQNRGGTGTGDGMTGAGVRVTGSPAHPGLEGLEGSYLARQTLPGLAVCQTADCLGGVFWWCANIV